jgi:hypothetical protein
MCWEAGITICRAEQQACREYMEQHGWDWGAAIGLADWMVEEWLSRKEMEEQSMLKEEEISQEGLNISGYHFKWKQAKMLAAQNERRDDIRLLPYWERVRVLFLELGGEYKEPRR